MAPPEVTDTEWIPFPGGELEGRRPKVLCGACRARLQRAVDAGSPHRRGAGSHAADGSPAARSGAPLCFECYRVEVARERTIKAAGELNTASEARFQAILPLEPVDRARLGRLRAERAVARQAEQAGPGRYVDRRRRAQIAARQALAQIGTGLRLRHLANASLARTVSDLHPSAGASRFGEGESAGRADLAGLEWSAFHAAELQFPEAWLPFVTAR